MAIETSEGIKIGSIVRKFIAENLVYDEFTIGNDDSFLENGIIDSTAILEVILFVEETFGIEVKDDEVVPENFDSVNKLASYILRKQSA